MTQPYPIRTLPDDELWRVLEVDSHAFGSTIDPEVVECERALHEPGRTIGACDNETLAGVATAFSFDLTVPGEVVPAAGVSWVGVLPVYRRRGVLRSLMHHQLHEIHDRGREAVSILWASEPAIYGRFGYGLATRALSLEVPRDADALRDDAPHDPALQLRLVGSENWKVTAGVYDDVASMRPGFVARNDHWHEQAVLDVPSQRQGRSALRCVVAEDSMKVRGYARYATRPEWSSVPHGVVHVREVVASDAAALAALYRYLFDLDLMATTELWNVPVDDPLMQWLTNTRAAKPRVFDALYVRLVDVRRALGARRYATEIETVIEVRDALCSWNEGRWRLVGGPSGASCEPLNGQTASTADLSLSAADLGAIYLGGTSLQELSAAGRVVELTPGAVAAASRAFSWAPAPWSPRVF